jgi:hypothetical protein
MISSTLIKSRVFVVFWSIFGRIFLLDFWSTFGPLWADYLSLVFEVNFRTFLPECSLLFLPRPLDEIAFEASGELRESAADRQFIARRNAGIQATENRFYDIRAFESAA